MIQVGNTLPNLRHFSTAGFTRAHLALHNIRAFEIAGFAHQLRPLVELLSTVRPFPHLKSLSFSAFSLVEYIYDAGQIRDAECYLELLYKPVLVFPKLHTIRITQSIERRGKADPAVARINAQLSQLLQVYASHGDRPLRCIEFSGETFYPGIMLELGKLFPESMRELTIRDPLSDHLRLLHHLTGLRKLKVSELRSPDLGTALWEGISSLKSLEVPLREILPSLDVEARWKVASLPGMPL